VRLPELITAVIILTTCCHDECLRGFPHISQKSSAPVLCESVVERTVT
jgi:hypothetical protein